MVFLLLLILYCVNLYLIHDNELRKNNFDILTKEEKDKLISELNGYSKSMEEILKYMEKNEMWDDIEEAANISADTLDFINMINKN